MIEAGGEAEKSPLDDLERQEAALWHRIELELHQAAVSKMGQGAIDILNAHEAGRRDVNMIAKTVGELTPIVLKILRTKNPNIDIDALAEQLGTALKERIEFHFRHHEIPKGSGGETTRAIPETD